MKLLICGSREITEFDFTAYVPEDTEVIITGGAKGIDSIGETYAREKGIAYETHLPEYGRYGRGAPMVRNKQMVDLADAVLAVWDGKSSGTKQTVKYAEDAGKPVTVVRVDV